MIIQSYDSFNKLKHIKESILFEIIKSGYLNVYESQVSMTILENGYINELFNGGVLPNDFYQICESKIIDKLKSWGDNIKKSAKEKIDDVKEKVAKMASNIKSFIDFIVENILEFLKKVFDKIKDFVDKALESKKDKIKEQIKKLKEGDIKELKDETKNLKEDLSSITDFLKNNVKDSFKKSLNKASTMDDKDIEIKDVEKELAKESYKLNDNFLFLIENRIWYAFYYMIKEDKRLINEFLNNDIDGLIKENKLLDTFNKAKDKVGSIIIKLIKLIKHIEHLPPFKYIHQFESFVSKNTNKFLEYLSVVANKINNVGGPFKYKKIGNIIGLFAGSNLKSLLTKIISSVPSLLTSFGFSGVALAVLQSALPVLVPILTFLYYTANALWWKDVLDEVLF